MAGLGLSLRGASIVAGTSSRGPFFAPGFFAPRRLGVPDRRGGPRNPAHDGAGRSAPLIRDGLTVKGRPPLGEAVKALGTPQGRGPGAAWGRPSVPFSILGACSGRGPKGAWDKGAWVKGCAARACAGGAYAGVCRAASHRAGVVVQQASCPARPGRSLVARSGDRRRPRPPMRTT